jgi:hypothetical protein
VGWRKEPEPLQGRQIDSGIGDGVKCLATALLIFTLEAALAAQAPAPKSAFDVLHESNPSITWNIDSTKTADVDCDGHPDTLMLGYEKDQVAVGIVSGAKRPPRIFLFPITRPDRQDGFCAKPQTINISPLSCDNEGGPLPGCKAIAGCKEFSIPDEGCDAFNFYWDASRATVVWWRH